MSLEESRIEILVPCSAAENCPEALPLQSMAPAPVSLFPRGEWLKSPGDRI